MSNVEQENHSGEKGRLLDILGDHKPQLMLFLPRDLGIAKAGQIDEVEALIDQEEVDEPRSARGLGHFGQPFSTRQNIEQGRLATVRSTAKCNLRKLISRKTRHLSTTFNEGRV